MSNDVYLQSSSSSIFPAMSYFNGYKVAMRNRLTGKENKAEAHILDLSTGKSERVNDGPSNSLKYVTSEAFKPPHSYIGLIAMAILSDANQRMALAEIYEWIVDNYPYFKWRGTGWRNSVRHNLSLNDCFVKIQRATNGKGHYWTIHPANLHDFMKGDFGRKRAQWKVKAYFILERAIIAASKNDTNTEALNGAMEFQST